MISGRFYYALLTLPFWLAFQSTGALAVAAPPRVEPCSLFTTTEVEQVIGKLKGYPHGPFLRTQRPLNNGYFPLPD